MIKLDKRGAELAGLSYLMGAKGLGFKEEGKDNVLPPCDV